MKQFLKMFFASFLAIFISGIVLMGVIVSIVKKAASYVEKQKVASGEVLVIDLSKKIHEQGNTNSLAFLSGSSQMQEGLYDIGEALKDAAVDYNIKGILIKVSPTPLNWATAEQLRGYLAAFKKSKKFIIAYGEVYTQGAYYIASVADEIYLNPAGEFELKGLATTLAFFKGALDKLEVEPQIFYAGKFKSATEPFRAYKISDPNRLQIQTMQNSIWEEFVKVTAEKSKKSADEINKLTQNGTIEFPQDAVDNQLITGLAYWDEVEVRLLKLLKKSNASSINYINLKDYDPVLSDYNSENGRIAILVAEGEIVDGDKEDIYQIASRDFCNEIRELTTNDRVKAVVLRVNSPGGSALASDVILRELQLLKSKKPLVVSMGDYAASGGYYIASNADSIFAMPTTITGSIGVFGMAFNIEKMMKNKLGVTFDRVQNAPYADLPSGTRTLTEAEMQRMQHNVDAVYELFKNHVVQGRKLNKADVDSIAQGRVWTGKDALNIHLVDALGGLDRAIASAAKLAKLKDYSVRVYPTVEDKFQYLMKKYGVDDAAAKVIGKAVKDELMSEELQYLQQLKKLKSMNGKAMMLLPYQIQSIN